MFILGAISYSELTYKRKTESYEYPNWAIGIGWTLACVSVIWIPIFMIYRLAHAKGTIAEVINTVFFTANSVCIYQDFQSE